MSFEPIKRILPSALRSAGISKQIEAVRVLSVAQETMVALWGEEKAVYIECVSFAAGELKVRALAPAALQELKVWEVRIRNEINRALGSKVILSLKAIQR